MFRGVALFGRRQVWAITTFRRSVNPDGRRDSRTVGLFDTVDRATEVLEKDYGDLDEAGYYRWAVIEPLPLGLYPINESTERLWFEHCLKDGWRRIDAEPVEMTELYRSLGASGVGSWASVG